MSAMIEKAARALADELRIPGDFELAAIAMLKAIKEMPDDMYEDCLNIGGWDYDPRVVWQAMIDAAIGSSAP